MFEDTTACNTPVEDAPLSEAGCSGGLLPSQVSASGASPDRASSYYRSRLVTVLILSRRSVTSIFSKSPLAGTDVIGRSAPGMTHYRNVYIKIAQKVVVCYVGMDGPFGHHLVSPQVEVFVFEAEAPRSWWK